MDIAGIKEFLDPQTIIQTLGVTGVLAVVFAESGLFFGFFLPGDSLLFTAGLLASQGFINIWILTIGGFVCAVLGDNVGYAFGRKIGPRIFIKEESLFFNRKHIERSKKFFEKHGKKALILARFMPIVRTFTPILAGVGRMEYKTFFLYNVIGGALWVFGMSFLGFFFGRLIPDPDKYLLPVVIIIILASFVPPAVDIMKERLSKH